MKIQLSENQVAGLCIALSACLMIFLIVISFEAMACPEEEVKPPEFICCDVV